MGPFAAMLIIGAAKLAASGFQGYLQNKANAEARDEAYRLAMQKRGDDLKQAGFLNSLKDQQLGLGRSHLGFSQDMLNYNRGLNEETQKRTMVEDQRNQQMQALQTFGGGIGSHVNLGNLKRSGM